MKFKNSKWQVEKHFLRNKVFRIVNGKKEYRQHLEFFPSGYPSSHITTYLFYINAQREVDELNNENLPDIYPGTKI